ncbi:PD40 domain-containing protein [Ktedonosporobacter rubrisoli]|nr:PD40 domain-containing protein [Ktedonosporobacter rubrisoli]
MNRTQQALDLLLHIQRSTTGNARSLTRDQRVFSGWKLAPDGHAVALFRSRAQHALRQHFFCDLISLSLDGGHSQVLARCVPLNNGQALNWSPDSRWLAYTSIERLAEEVTHERLFVVSADGSTRPQELRTLDEALGLSTGGTRVSEAPRWSKDGQRLYQLTQRGCQVFDTDWHRLIELSIDREVIGWVQPPLSATLWTPLPETLLLLTRNVQTKDTGLALLFLGHGESELLVEGPMMSFHPFFRVEENRADAVISLLVERQDSSTTIWHFDQGL